MTELSPLRGIDWLILFAALFALAIAGMSFRRDVSGHRLGGLLIIPMASAAAMLVGIAVAFTTELSDILSAVGRPLTALLALFLALVAAAVADLVFTRLVPLSMRMRHDRSQDVRGDIGLAMFVGGAALLGLATVVALDATLESAQPTGEPAVEENAEPAEEALGATWKVEGVVELPASPLGVALRNAHEGYLSIGGDRIMRFELTSDGEPVGFSTVAEGFTYARGLAVVGDSLIVADLGPLPGCPQPFPYCKGMSVSEEDPVDGERQIVEQSSGRLIAYNILSDGRLTDERVIIENLPVINTEHGVNGVVAGTDGYIYVAIGSIDILSAEALRSIEHPRRGLLGTVIRVSPDGDDLQVYARGLRNVYGLTFDEDGGLWGVDNDGSTPSGWRAEEILRIREGRHYGFPHDGSFGSSAVRDDWPVWHADGVGAAGLSWTSELGVGPGLLIGLCGHIDGVRLVEYGNEWGVEGSVDYKRLLSVPGCVSDITVVGEEQFLASIFDAEALYRVRVSPQG